MRDPVKVEIHMRPPFHPENRIVVNGFTIPRTHNVEFSARAGQPLSVRVELWADELTVDGEGFLTELTGTNGKESLRFTLEELQAFLAERR